jgi:uncharacterized protein
MPDAVHSVQFVNSEQAIPAELWAACFPPHIEGRWWYRVLEASGMHQQFEFLYALLLCNGQPIGIAPLFITRLEVEFLIPDALIPFLAWLGKMLPALSAPKALFVGCPNSDEGTVGLLPDTDRRAAFAALQAALEAEAARRNIGLIAWKDFPSSYDADLEWLASEAGLFRMTGFPGTMLTFKGPTKDDYFASLTSSRRTDLKRKLKRSGQVLEVDTEVVQNPDAATLAELHALFKQTRANAKTSFEELGLSFFEQIAREPVSHFIILRERATGKAVAFKLCFLLGEHAINKYIGIDYTRSKGWFPYFRLFDASIDWALAHGARTVQTGQTGYSAKLLQGHTLYPLTSYGKHRNGALQAICKLVTPRISWATLDGDLATYLVAHPDADQS